MDVMVEAKCKASGGLLGCLCVCACARALWSARQRSSGVCRLRPAQLCDCCWLCVQEQALLA